MEFGSCTLSEKALAVQHIKTYCENYVEKAIFTFDRGYPSMRLVDKLLEQKYVIKLNFNKAVGIMKKCLSNHW